MIVIEINDPALQKSVAENLKGEWTFQIDTVNGKPVLPEEVFLSTGTWEEARSKAEAHARTRGCKDGVDSIHLFAFTRDRQSERG